MSTIIAYSGTHDTGKTTAVYDRISALKKEYPGRLIGPHVENLIFCPYPINRESTRESQMWVFTNHIQSELNLLTRYDVVVSDRSAVDAIAYTAVLGFKPLADQMFRLVKSHLPQYSEIILMLSNGNHVAHDDQFRDLDPDFRSRVEYVLIEMYEDLGFLFESIGSGRYRLVMRDSEKTNNMSRPSGLNEEA